MSWLPNESDEGATEAEVWMPVPSSDTVRSGTSPELTVRVPDFAPVVAGSNCTYTLHVSLLYRSVVQPHLPAPLARPTAAPVTSIPLSVTDCVPVFVTVAACAAVAPSSMSCDPND